MNSSTLKAEWIKLRTVRSTWTTVVGATGLAVLFSALVPLSQVSQWDEMSPAQRADFDPASSVLIGVLFSSMILGALAVRTVTGEYTTGMIRTTFAAIPRRARVLRAKATVVALVATISALVANVIGIAVGQRILHSIDVTLSIGDPDIRRAVITGTLAVGLVAVLGVGLGGLLRRTTVTTALLVTALFGSQLFSVALPEGIRPYVPGAALQATVTALPDDTLLSPASGATVLAAYAIGALLLASLVISRRDA